MKKCKFFKVEARVLKSLVTRERIKIDPTKIRAVIAWPLSIDGKAMQRFMGVVNFHKEFSKDFARIAAPLNRCRNNHGAIEWTPERKEAFD